MAAYDAPRVMGVGGSIVPRWESARPGWMPRKLDWVVGGTYRGMPATTAPVRNLIGCNMSFRRAASWAACWMRACARTWLALGGRRRSSEGWR